MAGGRDGRHSGDASGPVGWSGHHRLVAQPHGSAEGVVAEAEATAAALVTPDHPLGTVGAPSDRRAPFTVGFRAAAGALVAVGLAVLAWLALEVLILIGLALVLALGFEPVVSVLVGRGWRRGVAVCAVCLGLVVAAAGFLAIVIPPLVTQVGSLSNETRLVLTEVQNQNSAWGRWAGQLHLQERVTSYVEANTGSIADGLVGFGMQVFGALSGAVIVLVLTVYFLAALPSLRAGAYRLVPHSRRPRVILVGDSIVAKVGAYLLANLFTSVVIAVVTFIWLLVMKVPYALALAVLVGLLDLIPTIGSIIAGGLVALAALAVSWPVAVATLGFYVVYKVFEDYLLWPRVASRAVQVPAWLTIVAVLVGGALLGVLGAFLAIPVAAAALVVVREVVHPRQDTR
ncbi:AI-2E family transporter [Actinomycetospora sp. TBRC 11914]|uniref:AI-2E family transporter n=1 Tax=Actinomycetospora sp. TBRC 11914 TaxID=2729387 RepID=UPI00145FA99B|nr:AI-2E family transporter [Actinomycetospora sp. TBRC 11914]NMO93070.1 AI-2E family transporter [Actinomycetospora sp. TBRC 11914]